MTDSDDTSQVAREREALRKTRAALDQLEEEEKHRFRGVGRQFAVVIALIVVGAAALWGYRALTAPKTASMSMQQYADYALARVLKSAQQEGRPVSYEGRQGQAVILIQVPSRGSGNVKIAKSSGDSVLDEWFYRIANLAGPLGPPPQVNPDGFFELWLAFSAGMRGLAVIKPTDAVPMYLRTDLSSCEGIDMQATKLAGEKRFAEAAELFDKAIGKCTPDASRLTSRGVVASMLGDKAAAEKFIKQGIDLAERQGNKCRADLSRAELDGVHGAAAQNTVPETCRKVH